MASGWLVFALISCIVLCSGLIIAVMIMRASWIQREREALTSTDLVAVEESAVLFIEQLKMQTDQAVSELDERCAALRGLIAEADKKIAALKKAAIRSSTDAEVMVSKKEPAQLLANIEDVDEFDAQSARGRILDLAAGGLDYTDIAKATGLDCAEVKLVLSLSKLPTKSISQL